MKGDLYVIFNATGHALGAFSAEAGTGGDRVAGALASADEITVKLVRGKVLSIDPIEKPEPEPEWRGEVNCLTPGCNCGQ